MQAVRARLLAESWEIQQEPSWPGQLSGLAKVTQQCCTSGNRALAESAAEARLMQARGAGFDGRCAAGRCLAGRPGCLAGRHAAAAAGPGDARRP